MLSRALDRLVLRPTTQPVFSYGRQRKTIPCAWGDLDVWYQTHGCEDPSEADLFVLKFGGTNSRAERSGSYPTEYWRQVRSVTWAVNLPGYGGSSGRASLRNMGDACRVAWDALSEEAGGRPVVVVGNSLGATLALHVASRCPVQGVVLRNPPPIREVIVRRYGWWNLGAHYVGSIVPRDLCSLRNADRSTAPALFITSGKDRIVPASCQHQVFTNYSGPKQRLHLDRSGHDTPLSPQQRSLLQPHADWLLESVLPACRPSVIRQHGGQPRVPAMPFGGGGRSVTPVANGADTAAVLS